MNSDRRYILPGLLLVLVVVGGYYYFKPRAEVAPSAPVQETKSAVHVVRADEGDTKNVPDGFPKDIPIEKASITESYRVDYALTHATQYTIGFTTDDSIKDALASYQTYMTKNGYTIATSTKSFVAGSKASQDLTATVGLAEKDKRHVIVTLLVH